MVKILAIGDVHFKVTNIPEVEMFITRITELAREESPDFIVILGDVLDTHEKLHSMPLNKAKEFIHNLSQLAYTYVLVGNHDMYNNAQFLNSNHWMNILKNWENVEIADTVLTCENEGEFFVFVPYVPPGRFEEALDSIGDIWRSAACIFAHQEFYGCKMESIVSVSGDRWPASYPKVISGHIHTKHTIGENIFYTGSAMQHTFGECHNDNSVAVIEVELGNFHMKEIDLGLPRRRVISTNLEGIMDLKIPETADKIMVSISDINNEAFKAFKKTKKYKELEKAGIKIKFQPKRSETLKEITKESITKGSNFREILHNLVIGEKDPYLTAAYECVVHGNEVQPEDIMYI